MKKTFLFFAFAAFVAFGVSAQKFQLGVKGGLNFPSADAYNLDDDDGSGWHVGAFGLIKVSKFGIQPEILYSRASFEGDGDVQTDFDFISVPIMAKFYLIQGLNIQAGPQFSILTASETEGGGVTIDNTEILKDTDLSLGIGAGFDLPFGLNINARYLLGLTDLADGDDIDEINTDMFQVSIGFALVKLGL